MKNSIWIALVALNLAIFCGRVFGQGFFEYGRAVGSIPHGQGITGGGKTPGGITKGGGAVGGVGDLGGQALPTRLVVASKSTGLYPRQDEEAEKIDQLSQGEALVPLMQISGGNPWYMVKTSKGAVGWVKGTDVRAENEKK
jgi:hypothetical protein